MIKANELRIGVLIIDYTGIVREVYGEDIQQQCWYEEGQSGTTEAPLNPIPLTTEWLERCGFKTREEPDEGLIYSVLKMDLDIIKSNDGYYLYTNNTDPWHNRKVGRKIESVHHLQNIYLDLTGEELNVKL